MSNDNLGANFIENQSKGHYASYFNFRKIDEIQTSMTMVSEFMVT